MSRGYLRRGERTSASGRWSCSRHRSWWLASATRRCRPPRPSRRSPGARRSPSTSITTCPCSSVRQSTSTARDSRYPRRRSTWHSRRTSTMATSSRSTRCSLPTEAWLARWHQSRRSCCKSRSERCAAHSQRASLCSTGRRCLSPSLWTRAARRLRALAQLSRRSARMPASSAALCLPLDLRSSCGNRPPPRSSLNSPSSTTRRRSTGRRRWTSS
mmetsp:Transcript_13831/g.40657  ORF Transcript_13831/g.40657 Transcript_13831/m.40657 type:complete len:215 (-) Transcript_13831:3214-3858(-)